ncbi:MAG TPA: four helix bundle protein [Terriglobia bacterium]|nr:four helix bundle protein [Terriglobia bacterium]
MAETYQSVELKKRSKLFAIRIVKLFRALPRTDESRILGKQVLRSGTSVAANYRAVCRARSKAEFIAKIGIVVEEIDETIFWLELLVETAIVKQDRLEDLLKEASELLAIFAASQRTARRPRLY